MVVLLLLRGAEDDIRAPHGRSPSVISRLFPKVFARVGQPLVMFLPEDVGRGTGSGIADFPKSLNELFASLVGGQLEKGIAFVLGDNVSDVPLQPVAIILLQFLFFLAKTDSAACEEHGRNKHDCPAGKNPEAARAVHPSRVTANCVPIQTNHRRIPYSNSPSRTAVLYMFTKIDSNNFPSPGGGCARREIWPAGGRCPRNGNRRRSDRAWARRAAVPAEGCG